MVLANMLEDSGYKDLVGAGIVLTGGMTKLDGLKDLASAIFDNMPVRIARPKEMDGLYEILRDPANSCAIGLCMYGAGEFTPYEIDSEKKMRYKGELRSKPKTNFNIFEEEKKEKFEVKKQEKDDFEEGIELANMDINLEQTNNKNELANIADISKQEKKPSALKKFWHSMTQLFWGEFLQWATVSQSKRTRAYIAQR